MTFGNYTWILDINGIIFFTLDGSNYNEVQDTRRRVWAFVSLSVGPFGIWAVDQSGRTFRRGDVDSKTPQGRHWKSVTPYGGRVSKVFSGKAGVFGEWACLTLHIMF